MLQPAIEATLRYRPLSAPRVKISTSANNYTATFPLSTTKPYSKEIKTSVYTAVTYLTTNNYPETMSHRFHKEAKTSGKM